MYSGTRQRAKEHIGEQMEKGVEKGRITAGQEGAIWKGLGARALHMTKVQVSEKGTITNNRGGVSNASGPLGIDLPEHEGP